MSFLPAEVPKDLEVTHLLFSLLESIYLGNTAIYDQYVGSLLCEAVYQMDYSQLGILMGELFPIWEGGRLFEEPLEALDGHNGFEEFFIHVLQYQFEQCGAIENDKFRLDRLETLWNFLFAMNENDWKRAEEIVKKLLENPANA